MNRIKMRVVLAEINQDIRDGQPYYFSIGYIKADGTYGFKAEVRKSGSTPQKGSSQGSSQFKYKVKEKGVLMLQEEGAPTPFAIKISRVIRWNGMEVWH